MDLEEGALVEPVAVAVQITKVGNVRPDQTVVVFGCGPIGLLCQAVSKAYAARKVIGVDISQSRTEFALSFGADDVFIPPAKPEGTDEVEWSAELARIIKQDFNLGEGPDVVLEATGAYSCIQTGVHLAKKGGTYVQAGMGREVRATVDDPTWSETDNWTERCFSHNHGLHSRSDHSRFHSVHHWVLPDSCKSDRLRKNRREATRHEPVRI